MSKSRKTHFYAQAEKDGVTYNKIEYSKGSVTCFISDLDVAPGVKTVEIDVCALELSAMPQNGWEQERLQMPYTTKSFPDVEKLVIGERVKEIRIPNSLFPNIKEVVSHSPNFVDGVPFLAQNVKQGSGKPPRPTFINAFIHGDGETLSVAGAKKFREHAFEGCGDIKLVDTGQVRVCDKTAFSEGMMTGAKTQDGCRMIGTIIVGADANAKTLKIPEETTCILNGALRDSRAEAMEIPWTHESITAEVLGQIPFTVKRLTVDVGGAEFQRYDAQRLKSCTRRVEYVDIVNAKDAKSIDGVVYSDDGKTKRLLMCPYGRTKGLVVAEGTEEISANACQAAKIGAVVFPYSLAYIADEAFEGCNHIKEVTIPKSVRQIGYDNFPYVETIHVENNKPVDGILDAIMWYSPDDEPWDYEKAMYEEDEEPEWVIVRDPIMVDMDGFWFAIPPFTDADKFQPFRDAWNQGEFRKDLARELYKTAAYEAMTEETALAQYRCQPDKSTRQYLIVHAEGIASRYIEHGNDAELADFLKLGFLDGCRLRRLLDEAQEKNNSMATAYILDALRFAERDEIEL